MKAVLVVDDEYAIVDALKALLEDEGYIVATASDGREALARLRETTPDVVLLDLMMPVMDGRETLRAIRADPVLSQLPVVLMSAAKRALHQPPAQEASAILPKPFSVERLLELLRELASDN